MVRLFFLILIFIFASALFGIEQKIRHLQEDEFEQYYSEKVLPQSGWLLELKVPGSSSVEKHIIQKVDLNGEDFSPFNRSKFHATLSGFLKVKKSSLYSLELTSDDSALLYIDGLKVIDNRGMHPLQSKKEEYYLYKGWHYITIHYDNIAHQSALKFSWAPKGMRRQVASGADLALSKEKIEIKRSGALPPPPTFVPESHALEKLKWNQFRFFCFLGLIGSFVLLFWGKPVLAFFKIPQTWLALCLLGLAFGLKLLFYWENFHLTFEGIQFGGDYYHYLLLPLQFVVEREFISLNCGNLALLIPLLGLIYQFFEFYPGIYYFSVLLILLSSLAILFPWFLVRKKPYGWMGLLGALFLAIHPLLTELSIPYVSTAFLGFFTLSLAICLSVKALIDHRLSSYIWAGLALALMMMTRTVFIPFAVVLVLGLVVLSPFRLRAFSGVASFLALAGGYDWLAQKELLRRGIEKGSYYLFFIRDGVGGSVVHRQQQMPEELWNKIVWLPHNLSSYFQVLLDKMLPLPESFLGIKVLFSLLLIGCFVVLLFKLPRVGLFLVGAFITYLFEIASYHVHERMLLPLCSILGIVLVLALIQLKARKLAIFLFITLFTISGSVVWSQTQNYLSFLKKEEAFLTWVKNQAPANSLAVIDIKRDPWRLFKKTGIPVLYNAPKTPMLVLPREVVPIRRVTLLKEEALDGLAKKGYNYILFDKKYVETLKRKGYSIELLHSYPFDQERGIWQLSWAKPKKVYPDDFDRFLWYWKKKQ